MKIPASNIDFRSRLDARFSRMLDSISNLAVSAPQHEVYAVALQGTPPSLQLVFAGNAAVPEETTEHIDTLWQYLKILAEGYAKFHQLSPPQAKRDTMPMPPSVSGSIVPFEREALKFCREKLNRRFSKHLASFKQIDCSDLPPKSRFSVVYRLLMSLTKGLEKRADFDDDDWDNFMDAYQSFDRQVDLLLQEDLTSLYGRMKKDFPIDRCLMKLTAFSKNIKILLNRAESPRLLPWFRSRLTIQAIAPSGPLNFSLPNSPDEWREVVNCALESINKAKEQACLELYEEIPSEVMSDVKKIINKPCNHQIYAHCECTLLAHMHANRDQSFHPHIGLSKLSCRGCFFTIQAVNIVYQTNFHTQGCHNKWYYPWAVPSSLAADKAVTSEIYFNLADRFGSVYAGFRPKKQRLDSDSETGKISSAGDTKDEDGVERK
ncbi:hypothetical protein MMC31_006542 [Peltigera leucophlebia]|nr:hypothetical protein [Peltigera leucophlebia]